MNCGIVTEFQGIMIRGICFINNSKHLMMDLADFNIKSLIYNYINLHYIKMQN